MTPKVEVLSLVACHYSPVGGPPGSLDKERRASTRGKKKRTLKGKDRREKDKGCDC